MTTDQKLFNVLREFGLTDAEITVYVSSLQTGSQPASVISKKAHLKRGHTYNVLATLIQKGLVQEFTKGKVRFFTISPPQTLLTIVQHKKEALKMIEQNLAPFLPVLDKLRNPLLKSPKVIFFQGVEGIKHIYEDTINVADQPIYAFGDFDYYFPEDKNAALHDWIWDYSDRRAQKGIWYRGIVNKSEKSDRAYKLRSRQKRKLKMLIDVHLPVEVNIYGGKVAIMSTYRDMVGLIIEDIPIAETLRNFHAAVWEFLPDYSLSGRSKKARAQ